MFATPIIVFDVPDAGAQSRPAQGDEGTRARASGNAAFQSRRLAIDLGYGSLGRRAGDQAQLAIGQSRQSLHHGSRRQAGRRDLACQYLGQCEQGRSRQRVPFHPGSFWSAVYYVDDGGISTDQSLRRRASEFMDPRGPGPAMYAPQLAYAMPGGLSVGANEMVRPRPAEW